MRDVMIDLETMSTESDAAIVGIGAVFFDMHAGTMGQPFYRPVHLATSVARGGRMDAGTVLWWLSQGDEARRAITCSLYHVDVALAEFSDWLLAHGSENDIRPWGNGAAFDIVIVENAMQRSEIDVPWRFWNHRCFRTVKNLYPKVEPDQREGTHHKADDDAVFQAQHLMKIVRSLRAVREAA